MKIIYTLFALLISATTMAQPDKKITIAIAANDADFFEDYPVDTLISHLNLLNDLPAVQYVKAGALSSNPITYSIKLKLFSKKDDAYTVSTGTQKNGRAVMSLVTSPGGQTHYQLGNELGSIETVVSPSLGPRVNYLLNLEIKDPEKSKRLRYKQFTVTGSTNEETGLIISMIKEIQAFAGQQHAKLVKH